MKCPHCGNHVGGRHSAFVKGSVKAGVVEFDKADYQEDPTKVYKRPKAERARQLSYYYRNRDRVLAREKVKREERKAMVGV